VALTPWPRERALEPPGGGAQGPDAQF